MAEKSKQQSINIKNNASALKIMGACIFVFLVFCAGFILRGNNDFMTALGFPSLTSNDSLSATADSTTKTSDSVASRVSEVETLLREESVTSYDLDAATDLVIQDLVASTNDPYLKYYSELEYQRYLSQTTDPDAGIGVLFSEYNGRCYATDVFENSEAEASGVLVGDYIVAIDGEKKSSWTTSDVVSALEREEGKPVHVTWCHPENLDAEGGREYDTNLVYKSISEQNVTTELVDSVGYIDIKQISSDSGELVRQATESLINQGAQSILLDLRGVSGGYLTQALDIASAYVPSGSLVQIKSNNSTSTRTALGNAITDIPLVVLINETMGGPGEVLASALQESNRAQLVGTTTLGKGTVQVMQPLSFGGAIRYTAATYYTSSGRQIDGNGVRPDYTVSSAERQKDIALEFASAESGR
ncbi:MAG: S41 family peptidase [Anaerotardibacter sp.]